MITHPGKRKTCLRIVMAKAGTTRNDELLIVTGISIADNFLFLMWLEAALSDQLISQNTGKN